MALPRIIGIHPVGAREPVHLVEMDLAGCEGELDWPSITQSQADRDHSNWQAPYDERQVPGASGRWCFFFHFLDCTRPLASNLGELQLPHETPLPAHLHFIKYDEP